MKRLLIALTALLFAAAAFAQDEYASGFGLDPSDAAAVKKINARMARIRKTRPTVALVLSGGGAKGGAHIGVLHYLEEIGMPVDLVVGTSIGGLIGGFVALGYSAGQIDSMVRGINWDRALSDRVDRRYIPYARTKYRERYAVAIPFFYDRRNFERLHHSEASFSSGLSGELDLSPETDPVAFLRRNLTTSLPSGLVFGQNVNNIFSSISAPYQDSLDFLDLPIPYACVATDLVSGRAKIWHSGSLTTALRSTMSIPGLFTPVRTRGMVLVDGGMRNNFPTDLAVKMGADLVIGVDLSNRKVADYSSIHNIGDVIGQSVDMLSNDSFRRNVKITDVTIRPDVSGYNMMSFHAAAIDTLIRRGYEAARAKAGELATIKQWVGGKKTLQAAPAIDVAQTPVAIRDIVVTGLYGGEAEYVLKMLRLQPGDLVSRRDIEEDVARVYGTGMFDYVTWELLGSEAPYRLQLNCKKGPVNLLGLGFRIDSEEVASILLNLGLMAQSIRGQAVDFNAKLGINPLLGIHWHRNRPGHATPNGDISFRWVNNNNLHYFNDPFTLTCSQATQKFYFSNISWSTYDVNLGLRNDVFRFRESFSGEESMAYVADLKPRDYLSAFLKMRAETLDDGYYPASGYSIGLGYQLGYSFGNLYREAPFFHVLHFDAQYVWRLNDQTALIPQMQLRMLFGERVPLAFANLLGGAVAGRYLEQQLPFIGIDNAIVGQKNLFLLRNDLRFTLAKDTYLSCMANYAMDLENLALFHPRHLIGIGAGIGYDSFVGPLKLDMHWSNATGFGVYVAMGFDF